MQSWLLVMAMTQTTNNTIGLLRIHGELIGVIRDSSIFKEVLTCVHSPCAMLILMMYWMLLLRRMERKLFNDYFVI